MTQSDRPCPRVSIGLPVYNGEKYLAAAIESILAQSYRNFELIISDNGSTDGTEAICRAFACSDERVRYVRSEENRGAAWNFNRVVKLARGEFFRWAAYDDLCGPDLLKCCVETLDAEPETVLCATSVAVIDSAGAVLPPSTAAASGEPLVDCYEPPRTAWLGSSRPRDRFRAVLLHSVRCYEEFGLIRMSAMGKTGLHRPFVGAEKVFLAELSLLGAFRVLPEVKFYSRWHDDRFSALPTARDQVHWVIAKRRRWFMPRRIRCTLAYLGLIPLAPIPWRERFACLGVYLRFVFRLGKIRAALGDIFTGKAMTAVIPTPATDHVYDDQSSASELSGSGVGQAVMAAPADALSTSQADKLSAP